MIKVGGEILKLTEHDYPHQCAKISYKTATGYYTQEKVRCIMLRD